MTKREASPSLKRNAGYVAINKKIKFELHPRVP